MDVSRYEVNRQVRMVLNRYGIDLTRIDYSCIGSTVYFSGELLNTSEGDIVPAVIESLFRDIARLSGVRNVQSDLQNWNISADGNLWQITKSKKKSRDVGVPLAQYGGTAEAAKDVHIETSEEIADVLKDIQEKTEQENRK
jgi:hypothetical protein